jgi:tetratricopeptide (TPR) repeat protein
MQNFFVDLAPTGNITSSQDPTGLMTLLHNFYMISKIIWISCSQVHLNQSIGWSSLMEWLYSKGIPIEAQFLYRKALEMSTQGKDATALKYYRQALIIAPKYSRALYEMGNSFAHLGMYPEAIDMYDRAIHIDPGSREIMEKRDRIQTTRAKKKD